MNKQIIYIYIYKGSIIHWIYIQGPLLTFILTWTNYLIPLSFYFLTPRSHQVVRVQKIVYVWCLAQCLLCFTKVSFDLGREHNICNHLHCTLIHGANNCMIMWSVAGVPCRLISLTLIHGLSFTQQGHKYTRTNLYPLLDKKKSNYLPHGWSVSWITFIHKGQY